MGNPFRICLFSPVAGRITRDGAAVAHVTIEREAVLDGRSHRDRTESDADGRFAFPEMAIWSLRRFRLKEDGVEQKMWASDPSAGDIEIWWCLKNEWHVGAEVAHDQQRTHMPIQIACELTEPLMGNSFGDGRSVIGRCTFLDIKAEREQFE